VYVRVQDAEAHVFGPKEASVNMLLRNVYILKELNIDSI